MSRRSFAWRVGPLAVALVAVVVGTAVVPYLFPTGAATAVATSSVIGYNNSVAYVWYVATVLVAGVFLARLLRPPTRRLDRPPLRPASGGIHWGIFAAIAGAHVLVFAAIYAYKGRFVFFDGVAWQTYVYRMSLGEIPIRDFAYYYGPSMIYPAHWLQGILSVEAAYGIWYVGTYVAGLFMLQFLLARFLPSKRAAALWFALLSIGLVSVAAGVNVTPFRYLLPAAIFVAVIDLLASGGWWRFGFVVAALSFAALYGFEIAVLSACAVLIPAALAVLHRPALRVLDILVGLRAARDASPGELSFRRLAVTSTAALAIAVGISIVSLLALDRSGTVMAQYAGASFAYLGGAHNQPMYPHAPFLVLAGISVLAAGATLRVLTIDRRRLDLAVVGGFLLLGLLAQRASFGTVDPSHISAWGLSALLLVLWLATRWPWGARLRRWLFVAVIAGFVLPLQIYQASQIAPFFGLVPGSSPLTASGQPVARSATVQASLAEAVSAVGSDRPYLMYGFNYYSFPVYEQFRLRYPQYSTDLLAARNPKDIEELIGEVRRSSAYVVIRRTELNSDPTPPRVDPFWEALTLVTGAPMSGSTSSALLSNAVAQLHAPFIAFLRTEYRTVYERDGLLVLAPRG